MAGSKSNQDDREIGGRIRTLRKSQKMKQQTLADLLKVPSRSTISDIERGRRRASPTLLKAIAAVFAVSADSLLGTTASASESIPDTRVLKASIRSELDVAMSSLERVNTMLTMFF